MTKKRYASENGNGRRNFRPFLVSLAVFTLTVGLYLMRLEAYTNSDIFLPTDYHSQMPTEGSTPPTIDMLNAYYETYARQDGRPYTLRQDLLLSRLAYIVPPPGFRGETEGITVGELCLEIENALLNNATNIQKIFGRNREETEGIVSGIAEHAVLRNLRIVEYFDGGSGFAGYVFASDEEVTMALRGTDDAIDSLDNALLLPFNISVQYADIIALLSKYGSAPRIWLTGHSKGGHNAIFAASIDPRCFATGFNAPGFGVLLTDEQHGGLERGVNYVINGDITGFLLFHLEHRIVLESVDPIVVNTSINGRHKLDNFFAVDDLTVAAAISPFGIFCELTTQIVWLLLVFLAIYCIVRLVGKSICFVFQKRLPG